MNSPTIVNIADRLGTPHDSNEDGFMARVLQQSIEVTWAVYLQRADGDYDIVAIFPADSERTLTCKTTEQPESCAYHYAHELTTQAEYGDQETSMIVPFATNNEPPSVYSFDNGENKDAT